MISFKENLAFLLKAKTKCIWIRTYEEQRAINDITSVIVDNNPGMSLYTWSSFEGKIKVPLTKHEKKSPAEMMGPDMIIQEIIENQKKGSKVRTSSNEVETINKSDNVYLLKDFHLLNDSKILIRAIRDAKERPSNEMMSYNPIVIISPIINLPIEHEKLFTIIDYSLPEKSEISLLLKQFTESIKHNNKYTMPSKEVVSKCVELAQGLTIDEIKNYCARSLAKYSTIKSEEFYSARLDLIKKTGILEYLESDSNMADMGGNHIFKEWVHEIKDTFSEEAELFGVQKSKGFLGLGVPGTAKTLSAQMIAKELNLPLLKFNMSRVMHSHVGQSEKNMENAIDIIKKCSPCVLLIDEAEKTLSGM